MKWNKPKWEMQSMLKSYLDQNDKLFLCSTRTSSFSYLPQLALLPPSLSPSDHPSDITPPVHPLFLPSPISYHLLHCSLLREDVITSTTTMASWWRLLHTSQHAASWKLCLTSNEKNSNSPGSSRSKERW